VRLLTRTTRSVEPTEAGVIFASSPGTSWTTSTRRKGHPAHREPDEAALTLGYTIGAGLEVVPWLLRTFAANFPQRQLRSVEYDFSDPTAGLRESAVHAAIIRPPTGLAGLITLELLTEDRVACVPEGHRLADRDTVQVADLLSEPIIAAPEHQARGATTGSWPSTGPHRRPWWPRRAPGTPSCTWSPRHRDQRDLGRRGPLLRPPRRGVPPDREHPAVRRRARLVARAHRVDGRPDRIAKDFRAAG